MDLARGEELEVHVRKRLVQPAHDLDVVVEVDMRRLATDHVDLREAGQLPLPKRVLDELLAGVRVGARLLLRDGERAELALHPADVRLVQIQVLDEVGLVGAAAQPPRAIGQLAECEQVVGLEQRQPVLEVEALARLDLLADRLEGVDSDRHQRVLSTAANVRASSSSRQSAPFSAARARAAESRAAARDSSSAPDAATQTSAPSSEPPASASRTTGSTLAASSSGSVGVPSRRSVPGTLPVSVASPEQSRTSSAIW